MFVSSTNLVAVKLLPICTGLLTLSVYDVPFRLIPALSGEMKFSTPFINAPRVTLKVSSCAMFDIEYPLEVFVTTGAEEPPDPVPPVPPPPALVLEELEDEELVEVGFIVPKVVK